MHWNKDYSKSPAKQFDAVEDIKFYLGDLYADKAALVKNVPVNTFDFCCAMLGIKGYPVEAWYDHFHGQGAYVKNWCMTDRIIKAQEDREAERTGRY